MSRNTNTGISANEDFQTYFEKTFYWSDTGTMQINLKAKTPLNGDTLYLAFDQPINFSHNFIYTDSFTSSNIPKLWKTLKGKPGGGRGVYWGRGKAEFINAKKDLLKNNFIKVRISEDPTIDIYTIEY